MIRVSLARSGNLSKSQDYPTRGRKSEPAWTGLRPLATTLLELLNHVIEIGIAGAKASSEPVSTTPGDSLAIGKHFKLASLARRNYGFNAQSLSDKGHETRDLGFVVLSCRAGTYLNFHSVLRSISV